MTPRCILTPLASPDTLRGQVTGDDWTAAAVLPPRRQAEYLTWRAVVYRELGRVHIGYDAAGGPVLIDDARQSLKQLAEQSLDTSALEALADYIIQRNK